MKEFFQRTILIVVAVTFLLTAVGITIASFLQNNNTQTVDESANQESTACSIQQPVPTEKTLPEPKAFKATGDVTKLETVDLEDGSGEAVKPGDCVALKYYGSLAKSGEKFDSNFDTPLALQVKVGAGQVIPGFEQGLIGAKLGGLRRIIIPSELGYGAQSTGKIPANSDLVFTISVVSRK